MNKKIILMTGGGSAGHVTPNVALMPKLREAGFEIHYVGTADGIEKKLIAEQKDVVYHEIEAGKLRRYLSLKNLTDPFRVIKGVSQAKKLVRELRPDVVFSKGGFVSVPVVMGAKRKCPVICHESDYTPGLANKIAARYADTVCVTFEDTLKYTGKKHAVHTGTPIRRELYSGSRERGLAFLGFSGEKPIILVMGGSLGATAINDGVRAALPELGDKFDVVHLCGKGKLDETVSSPCYRQYEYISAELPDILAATDLVVSRSGANAVFEFLALRKPALFIPLPLEASRGDQILNANYVTGKGYAMQMDQKDVNAKTLVEKINELYERRAEFIAKMERDNTLDGTDKVLEVIKNAAENGKKE
ncbi:MAG: undecaprenyldiphospho-muramoylpentapeptide beta-N-acetylglucosaminyltransferase [Clostridia bacterium]|nr:undecaprenyldiphospho-muramoylpentapeptide beta-N-acetylglucosaminyltransferase [Clostridia bacterium]MBQ3937859.1 undecaprenyldiphospho-muramoylpentapeptide beta-N-acetylglucosaminyltransferase [Clostridia bacterium]MBR4635107.1 undecaprenyldiphospho-muramoylpentapeptide beta-N-acetylglucosaminyltransferase [Clostridia bacterium]